MKTKATPVCLLFILLSFIGSVSAQTFTTLASFEGPNGANPQASLVASGNFLYGTTYAGGISNSGAIFSVNITNGVIAPLYSFTNGNDGQGPDAGLVLLSNVLYGTASLGGPLGAGTLFAFNLSSNTISNVYNFNGGQDGGDPEARLLLAGNTLYGTTFIGGTGDGTVFRINTDGSSFTNLHNFTGGANGSNPESSLILSGNTLYGTTYGPYFGGAGYGTVFKLNITSLSFSNLYVFTNGTDGANPEAGLILSGSTLYGTASGGGSFDNGTVFAVSTNGAGFQSFLFDYSDGANPQGDLLLVGSTLYGAAPNGGGPGWGTIFSVNTDGSNFTNLYAFTDDGDGASPEAGLTLVGTNFYGTTAIDTEYNEGTVFALNAPGLSVPLSITLQNGEEVLTWSEAGFSLLSSTNVRGAYTNVTGAISPYTNILSGKVRFFQLMEN